MKKLLLILLLISIAFSFIDPPRDSAKRFENPKYISSSQLSQEALQKGTTIYNEYNGYKAFVAIYQNTFLSWFGKSLYIANSSFLMLKSKRWEDFEPKDYGEYFMMILAYILPYILLLTTIILWFKCYLITGKQSGKEQFKTID